MNFIIEVVLGGTIGGILGVVGYLLLGVAVDTLFKPRRKK